MKRLKLLLTSLFIGLFAFVAFNTSNAAAAPPGDSYIIVFKDGVSAADAVPAVAAAHGLTVGFQYSHALQGMSAVVPQGRLNALENDPRVAYVETNDTVQLAAQTVPTGIQRIYADTNSNLDIDSTDDYRVDVDVAVIDTGIDLEHPDLNVVGGVTCQSSGGGPFGGGDVTCADGGDDDHYHGTHVAGTVAALDDGNGVVGVAPGARLWAVKVLDSRGSGSEAEVVAGIDWVAANAGTIEVANMSLGGSGFSQAEYDAIQAAVDLGVVFVVAAGNSNDDTANYSPGGFDNVLSVSALADFDGAAGGNGSPTCRSDVDDTLADFSNWGSAVDIAAPGVCILSTYPLEQGDYGTISGTSMASPHVAGAAALLASTNNPNSATDVYNIYNDITSTGNFNWVDDSGDGIQEPLLDVTGYTANLIATGDDGGGTTDEAPTVSIDSPADGATFTSGDTVTFSGTATDTEDGDLSGSIAWSSDLDGSLGTGSSVSAALSDGTHTITASVTDSAGQTSTASISVTVSSDDGGGSTDPISLTANGYKVRGRWNADLTWSGATSTNVDIYVNGALYTTTTNDGAWTYSSNNRGGGSLTFQVCEAGTTTCSSEAIVNY